MARVTFVKSARVARPEAGILTQELTKVDGGFVKHDQEEDPTKEVESLNSVVARATEAVKQG